MLEAIMLAGACVCKLFGQLLHVRVDVKLANSLDRANFELIVIKWLQL